MAIERSAAAAGPQGTAGFHFQGRHWTVGTMVTVSVAIAAVLLVLLQNWAFRASLKWDLTSSGINSLSAGSRTVLKNLDDATVRLTSLYFEGDPEPDAQKKYRKAVNDLLRLYQVEEPSRVEVSWINPLKDSVKLSQVLARIRDLPGFQKERQPYQKALDRFQQEIYQPFKQELQQHLQDLEALQQPGFGGGGQPEAAEIGRAVQSWIDLLDQVAEKISTVRGQALPRYADATDATRSALSQIGQKMKAFTGAYLSQLLGKGVGPGLQEVLERMKGALGPWMERFEKGGDDLQNLPGLELDRIERTIQRENVLLVETDQGAKALSFEDLWPTAQPGTFADRFDFDKRRFAGEGAVTPALLQLLKPEKTAVVFVRHGGEALFGVSGFGPFAPRGPLTELKAELEKLNFVVQEWDLAAGVEPPEVGEDLARTIYVVLRPKATTDPRMGMPRPPQVTPGQRLALLDAVHESGRAIFLVGWSRSPQYEYQEYLKSKWGVEVQGRTLVISARSEEPGQWQIHPRGFVLTTRVDLAAGDITRGLEHLQFILPMCTALKVAGDLPEGVTVAERVSTEKTEDVWGVQDVDAFIEKYQTSRNSKGRNYTAPAPNDLRTPFPLVLSASKEEAKLLVCGAGEDMIGDSLIGNVPFFDFTAGRVLVQRQAPGNYALFINMLYYLSDQLEWMNTGSPIDTSRIEIAGNSLAIWRGVLVGLWPALAVVAGFGAWYVRRR